jgi:transcriptional regulator with XRE-family HTH domain
MESRVDVFARIRRDARVEGLSIRELARRHGIGRPTVRQALREAEPPAHKPRVRTAPRLELFKTAIDGLLTGTQPSGLDSYLGSQPRPAGSIRGFHLR